MIIYFTIVLACSKPAAVPQVSPDTTAPSVITEPQPSKPPLAKKNVTEALLTTGILDPIPGEVNGPFTVQFRSMYRNGCWTQSEVETSKTGQAITHQYTTKYEGEGKICTMALVPGGFTETMDLEPGTYNGTVIVDGDTRANYTVTVTP